MMSDRSTPRPEQKARRILRGFTLIELVVVILILGILAAIAAPRLLGTTKKAKETALKSALGVVRNALDRYAAQNQGRLPGDAGTEADFKADLAPYLRKFPDNPFKGGSQTAVQTTGAPLFWVNGPDCWHYDNKSGQFIANSNGTSSDGVTRYYEF